MASGGPTPKEDYYELLKVPSDADEDAIKKAYRRAALEWHPDKNSHRLDEATERFKDIQNAYAVLSDESERAWYDQHKEEILSGGAKGGEASRELVNLMKFFSAAAFGGFDDADDGFYTVYRKLFSSIAEEEKKYADAAAAVPATSAPSFGKSTSSSADVSAFYLYWSGYTTRMHFGWADKHNPSDAPSRWVRRQMEKENEGERRSAKRERSEQIRALVDFCKKRDKRWMAYQIELKKRAEEEDLKRRVEAAALTKRQKELREAAKAQLMAEAAAREEEIAKSGAYRLADDDSDDGGKKKKGKGGAQKRVVVVRSAVEELEEAAAAAAAASGGEDSDESEAEHVYECELCGKSFRSPAAMENHERSKKHLAAVAEWEAENGVQEAEEEEEEEDDSSDEEAASESEGSGSEEEDGDESGSEAASATEELAEQVAGSRLDEREEESGSGKGSDLPSSKVDYKTMRAAAVSSATKAAAAGGGGGGSDSCSGEEEEEDGKQKSGRKPNKSELRRQAQAAAKAAAAASKGTKPRAVAAGGGGSSGAGAAKSGAAAVPTSAASSTTPVAAPVADETFKSLRRADLEAVAGGARAVPMLARMNQESVADKLAAAVRGREAAGAEDEGRKGGKKGKAAAAAQTAEPPAAELSLNCAVCGVLYPTRNSLFQHIKKTGHAAFKTDIEGGVTPGTAAPASSGSFGGKTVGKKGRKGKRGDDSD